MVRLENISMRYGAGPEILKDLSFGLDSGSFTFLTGPSGAGKTTLLKLIYLAEHPEKGEIRIFGKNPRLLNRTQRAAMRRRIGVVFQDFRLLNHLSVFDNVALPLKISGHPQSAYARDVKELLGWVGLGDKISVKPQELSGGEQQRIAIARAVVARPDLLIADEPTGNVDPDMGARLIRLFTELNRLGTTVLIATHDRQLAGREGAHEIRLVDGHLIEMRH